MHQKTICRVDILGRVSSMACSDDGKACLVTTVLNGAHVLNVDDKFFGVNLSAGLSAEHVESYQCQYVGEEPVLSSCFVRDGELLAFGSAKGTATVVSRRSRGIVASYSMTPATPVRSVHAIPDRPEKMLLCTDSQSVQVDIATSRSTATIKHVAPRAIAAVPLTADTCAVAQYDGKVLLYDYRQKCDGTSKDHTHPTNILSIPDQITSMAVCPETHGICVGTVAGRVFTLRCLPSTTREQAFGTGTTRSPVVALSVLRNRVAAGLLCGRMALIDTAEAAEPTTYWAADTLMQRRDDAVSNDIHKTTTSHFFETTATTLSTGLAWAAFAGKDAQSHVIALPA